MQSDSLIGSLSFVNSHCTQTHTHSEEVNVSEMPEFTLISHLIPFGSCLLTATLAKGKDLLLWGQEVQRENHSGLPGLPLQTAWLPSHFSLEWLYGLCGVLMSLGSTSPTRLAHSLS